MKLRLDGEEGEDGDIAKAPLLLTSLGTNLMLCRFIFRTRQVVRMTMALPPHLLRSRRSPRGQEGSEQGAMIFCALKSWCSTLSHRRESGPQPLDPKLEPNAAALHSVASVSGKHYKAGSHKIGSGLGKSTRFSRVLLQTAMLLDYKVVQVWLLPCDPKSKYPKLV